MSLPQPIFVIQATRTFPQIIGTLHLSRREVQMASYKIYPQLKRAHQGSMFLHENQQANSCTQPVLFVLPLYSNHKFSLQIRHRHLQFHLVHKPKCGNIYIALSGSCRHLLNLPLQFHYSNYLYRQEIHA